MAMRWRLWKDDFHTSMFDFTALYHDDESAKPCKCSGRGRPHPQLSQLRLPTALLNQMEDERGGVKGKGRANILQQRMLISKEPGRRHKGGPLDDICSVSSESTCSSRSCVGQFSDYLRSPMDRPFSDSGRRRHILDLSDNVDNAVDEGNRSGFGVRVEEPQLNLKRDFPPLSGGQELESAERGSGRSLGSIGDIVLSSIGADDKARSEETKQSVVECGPELGGDNVIVIRGLPNDCEETVLMELLGPYGKILQCQRTSDGQSATFLVRYETTEACEWAASCLHDTEGLPGSPITVERQAEPANEGRTPDPVDLPILEQ